MGDVRLVEKREGVPAPLQEPVVEPVGRDAVEPPPRIAEHDQRVARRRLAGRDDRAGRDTAVAGEERHERLVLDCLAAGEPELRAVVLVEGLPPELGGELRVVGVASVDLDEQRPALGVATVEQEDAGGLAFRRREVLASTPSSRRPHSTSATSGRPAEVPNASLIADAAASATRKPATVPPGVAVPPISTPSTAETDDPAPDGLQRPDELRVHGEDDRRRLGDEDGREPRSIRAALDGVPEGRPVPNGESRRHECDDEGERERSHRLQRRPAQRRPTSAASTSTIAQRPSRS